MKETKKTIVSAGGEELPINNKIILNTKKDYGHVVDGINPIDINFIPRRNNVLIIPPINIDIKTDGGVLKTEAYMLKEKNELDKLPVLIISIGPGVEGYEIGDYVFLHPDIKNYGVKRTVEGVECVSVPVDFIEGKAKYPEKIREEIREIQQRVESYKSNN
jgi:hypothetical protein